MLKKCYTDNWWSVQMEHNNAVVNSHPRIQKNDTVKEEIQ